MSDSFEDEDQSEAEEDFLAEYPHPSNVFVRACADGNLDEVRRLLDSGEDINQRDQGFPTEGKTHDGKAYTGFTSDPRQPNTMGQTGLEIAIHERNLELVKLLMAAGANPFAPDEGRGRSAIALAVCLGFVDAVRHIVDDCGFPLKASGGKDKEWLLLQTISEENSLPMLRYLVEEKGMDLKFKSANGLTAASKACSRDVPAEFLEYCYQKGAVPNGTQHVTSLVKTIVAESAKQDIEDVTGQEFNLFESSMRLLDRFCDHSTLLNKSVFHGDVDQVRVHLKYGANPLQADDQGVDAYGILNVLRTGKNGLFMLTEKHETIRILCDKALQARYGNVRRIGPQPD